MITQQRLKELVSYDPETGFFTRLVTVKYSAVAGQISGYDDGEGYIRLRLDGKTYRAHRLAFLYMKGEMPEFVDHINRNRSDNRWCNIRVASKPENMRNRGIQANNKSGVPGVCWNEREEKWRAGIKLNGRKINLGRYEDIELAELVVSAAREKYHGEFAS